MNRLTILGSALLIAGCTAQQSAPQAQTSPPPVQADGSREVKSPDGSVEGSITGTPARGSKFARVQIGMSEREVEDLIGRPTDTDTHITGKSFIPFYFGGDTNRLEAFYKGEGQLTFSPSHFAGSANTLIGITVNTAETGYAH